jgi:DNA-binding MarR family transcriptional regulator
MGKKAKGKGKGKRKGKGKGRHELNASPSPEAGAEVAAPPEALLVRSSEAGRHTTPTELAARLANLSTVLQRELARYDAGDGLTRARLSALALLVLGGPRTLGELAAAERVRPPTMTRLVHAMEADGLTAREPNPADRRSVIIRATLRGEALLEKGRARQIAPLAERISDLEKGERALLEGYSDLLGRLLRETDWTLHGADREARDRTAD